MELLALIVLGAGFALSAWIYYALINLVIAAWMPARSKKKWLEILNHPLFSLLRPLIKWVAPPCLLLVLINLVLHSVLLVIDPG